MEGTHLLAFVSPTKIITNKPCCLDPVLVKLSPLRYLEVHAETPDPESRLSFCFRGFTILCIVCNTGQIDPQGQIKSRSGPLIPRSKANIKVLNKLLML